MSADPRAAARQFVRSLNILLKFARLYEFGHVRTAAQFETTWKELRSALDESGESGLLLGASGAQILLDGVPLGQRRPNGVSLSCCPHPELPAFILGKIFRKGISRALFERFRPETASLRRWQS